MLKRGADNDQLSYLEYNVRNSEWYGGYGKETELQPQQ